VKTIMLVDDSTTMLMSLKTVLTRAGFVVETAAHGREALDRITAGLRPDLIISDVNMPTMNGITFAREARKVAGIRFTPILMLTTESDQTIRTEAKAAGATGWLVKPFDPQKLIEVVKKVIG
jgi:two-component system chemotaxis response regulator CheY